MSKILLIGDVHAGVKQDSSIFLKTLNSFFLEFIPEVVNNNKITDVYILGDIFDNRNNLNVKTKHTVYTIFKTLSDILPKVHFSLIIGNHDIYYRNTREVNSIDFLGELSNVTIIKEMTEKKIGKRSMLLCPWMISKEEADELLNKKADVCLGHLEINGFDMVEGVVERNGLSYNKLRENFKLTFSGHFHLRSEKEGVVYVGTPYQTKWTDRNNVKGVYTLNLNNLNYNFIEFTNAPKFKKIFVSQIKKKQVDLKKEIENNFVSLVVDGEIKPKQLDQLNDLVSKLNPMSFNVVDMEKTFSIEDDLEVSASSPIEYLSEYIDGVIEDEKERKNIMTMINDISTECGLLT